MSWGNRVYGSRLPQALRQRVLAEEPLCRACGAPATEVDHIQPRHRRPDLFEVRANLQALCRRCHARKTASADSKPRAARLRPPEPHPGASAPRGGSNLSNGPLESPAGQPAGEPVRVSGGEIT